MFCPFRSTAEKEVECSERCALYSGTKEEAACQINNLVDRLQILESELSDTNSSLEAAASALVNKYC